MEVCAEWRACQTHDKTEGRLKNVLCLKFVEEFKVGGDVCNRGRFMVERCWLDDQVAR